MSTNPTEVYAAKLHMLRPSDQEVGRGMETKGMETVGKLTCTLNELVILP